MKTIHLIITVVFAISVPDIFAEYKQADSDDATLLIGKWEVSKSNTVLAVGDSFEFEKSGNMHIQTKIEGKSQTVDLRYKVEGKKVLTGFKVRNHEEAAETMTIKSISTTHLTLVLEGSKTDIEFKRTK